MLLKAVPSHPLSLSAALVDEVIQSVHRMVAHFSAEAGTICGPPMATLLPPLSTLVCDGLNMGNGRAAGLFAKFRNRLWPVIEESCRQGEFCAGLDAAALRRCVASKCDESSAAFRCRCFPSRAVRGVEGSEGTARHHNGEDQVQGLRLRLPQVSGPSWRLLT